VPRKINEIIAHIRAVSENPSISTTLIQTDDLLLLCAAAERGGRCSGCGNCLLLDEIEMYDGRCEECERRWLDGGEGGGIDGKR